MFLDECSLKGRAKVSLAIRGGYDPEKFRPANTKTDNLNPKQTKLLYYSHVIRGFPLLSDPKIVKTANNDVRLYMYFLDNLKANVVQTSGQ